MIITMLANPTQRIRALSGFFLIETHNWASGIGQQQPTDRHDLKSKKQSQTPLDQLVTRKVLRRGGRRLLSPSSAGFMGVAPDMTAVMARGRC